MATKTKKPTNKEKPAGPKPQVVKPALVSQFGPTTCGQACVATVLGLSLSDAIKRVGHAGIMTDEMMRLALGTATQIQVGKPHRNIVAIQKHRDPNSEREHWTVSFKGETLDPAGIPSKKRWPVTKHFVVYWA